MDALDFGQESQINREPLTFQDLLQIQEGAQYQDHKDRYVGSIDPVTKLRHGEGVYTYHDNPFFQFQGHYDNGVKQTKTGQASTLLMRDGTRICGDFENGEITGNGVKLWPNGRVYQGQFVEGEMHGEGTLSYGQNSKDDQYEGQFHFNSREGQGKLVKKTGDVFDGTFRNNQPNGDCKISFANGDKYEGNVIRGAMTGQGYLETPSGLCYQGQFKEGKLHGEGTFSVKSGTYKLDAEFVEGEAQRQANKHALVVVSPAEPEEDPKAKKDPKKGAAAEEHDFGSNEIKVAIDTATEKEEQKIFSFEMKVFFQGESYEDPNPPEEDEAAKKKKGAPGGEPEVRMITPDPVLLANESGREFEFSLGRTEQVRVDPPGSQMQKQSTEAMVAVATGSGSLDKVADSADEGEVEYEEKWIEYHFDPTKEEKKQTLTTTDGLLRVEGLKYEIDPVKFPGGVFELTIEDVTRGIEESQRLSPIKVDLKVFNSVQDAEEAAQQAADKKGGKKK